MDEVGSLGERQQVQAPLLELVVDRVGISAISGQCKKKKVR